MDDAAGGEVGAGDDVGNADGAEMGAGAVVDGDIYVSSGANANYDGGMVDNIDESYGKIEYGLIDNEVTDNNAKKDKLIELIAEAYVLRAYYTGCLEEMRASAAADYKALSDENKTRQNQLAIGMNYITLAGDLEVECDRLMDNLISRIEAEIIISGGDKSLVGDIRVCYAEEKSLKKAYYLSLYS